MRIMKIVVGITVLGCIGFCIGFLVRTWLLENEPTKNIFSNDIIYIANGHKENITTGGDNIDVANTTWIGMGEDDASK